METVIMFFTHLLKSAEFFVIEGLPTFNIESIEALFWNIVKIVEIYLSIL
jgi:hypothetical protein